MMNDRNQLFCCTRTGPAALSHSRTTGAGGLQALKRLRTPADRLLGAVTPLARLFFFSVQQTKDCPCCNQNGSYHPVHVHQREPQVRVQFPVVVCQFYQAFVAMGRSGEFPEIGTGVVTGDLFYREAKLLLGFSQIKKSLVAREVFPTSADVGVRQRENVVRSDRHRVQHAVEQGQPRLDQWRTGTRRVQKPILSVFVQCEPERLEVVVPSDPIQVGREYDAGVHPNTSEPPQQSQAQAVRPGRSRKFCPPPWPGQIHLESRPLVQAADVPVGKMFLPGSKTHFDQVGFCPFPVRPHFSRCWCAHVVHFLCFCFFNLDSGDVWEGLTSSSVLTGPANKQNNISGSFFFFYIYCFSI